METHKRTKVYRPITACVAVYLQMNNGEPINAELEALLFEDLANMGGEEQGSGEPAGTSGVQSSNVVEPADGECEHFTGGSEFDVPIRIRHVKNCYPEDFQSLDLQLQEVVGRYTRATLRQNFTPTRRYLSDVVVIRDADHRRRLVQWLTQCGPDYPGGLFVWVDEGDHIHTIHDCPYSGGSCRCRFTKTEDFRRPVRDPMRRLKHIRELDEIDWQNVFLYFIVSKWQSRSQVWIGGRVYGPPSNSEILQWRNVQALSGSILAREDQGIGHNSTEQPSNHAETRKRDVRGARVSQKKGSKFEGISKKVSALLNKYQVIPPDAVRDIIPEEHEDFDLTLFDPNNEKYYEAACHVYTNNVNKKNLKDFCEIYKHCTPVFYGSTINPFDYYHDRETSANYLNELIKYQYGGDEDQVKQLLCNIKSWFNRLGWSVWEKVGTDINPKFKEIMANGPIQDDYRIDEVANTIIDVHTGEEIPREIDRYEYQLNSKINTIVCVGPANCGKNYFWDSVVALGMNVGHIGRVNNRTNQFSLQDAMRRRIVIGNEVSMEEGAKEDFKKLCEGTALNIRIKNKKDNIFKRTPVCLISNFELDICGDSTFNNIRIHTLRWKTAPLLAPSKMKPYPLAIFDLYDLYNISLD